MNAERVVVVTGAASGMGLAISGRFARQGHPVAMLDVQPALLEGEAANLRAAGGRVLTRLADVSRREQVEAAYAAVRRELGPISIVIANAGIAGLGEFLSLSTDAWQRMIDINLTGVFHTVQAAVPDMVQAQWGRVVTISSNAGQVGTAGMSHYSAAKGGVIAFTKAIARELAAHGITVNTVPPALVDTPMARQASSGGDLPPLEALARHIPIARPATPDDIADACEFLCSDRASYITGQQINVNGGMYM